MSRVQRALDGQPALQDDLQAIQTKLQELLASGKQRTVCTVARGSKIAASEVNEGVHEGSDKQTDVVVSFHVSADWNVETEELSSMSAVYT